MSDAMDIVEQSEIAIPKDNATMALFDTQRFDGLYRIAETLAQSSLIPESLRSDKKGDYPPEKVTANCFLVTEQAYRWGLSPFAVIGCASVVYGRLMWEGKLVAAVIEAKLGVRLSYEYSGAGDKRQVIVSGTLPGESEVRIVTGTVGAWKTTGNGSPWSNPLDHDRQLAYRGAREWARRHSPGVILGVLTDDEAQPMRNVTPQNVRKEVVNPFPERKPEAQEGPQQQAASAAGPASAPDNAEEVTVMEVTYRKGSNAEREWTVYTCELIRNGEQVVAKTFSSTVGKAAHALVGSKALAEITHVEGKGLRLDSISPIEGATKQEESLV